MRTLENKYANYVLEGNVLTATLKNGIYLDVKEMEEMLAEAVKFVGETRYFLILDMRSDSSSTTGAREYYSNNPYNKFRIADAVVVKSPAVKLLVNFFINFNRPQVPTRMFLSLDEAQNWIKSLQKGS